MNYAMAPANYGVAAPMGYAAAPAQTYALAANDSAALALDAADGVIDGKFYGQQVGIAAANVPRPRALSYAPPTPVVPAVYAAPVAAPQPYATPTTYYGAGGKRTTYVNVTEPPMNPGAKPRVSTYHLAQAAFSRHEREEERKEQLAQEEERKRKAYYDACAKTLPPTMARQERGVPDSYQGVHLPQARPTTRAMSMEDPGVPVGRSEPYHYANYDTNTAPRAPIPLTTAPKTTPPPAPKPSYTPEPAYVPPPAPAPVTIPPPAPSAPWTKTTKTSVKAHGSFAWGTMAADPKPEPAYVPPPAPPAPAPPRIPSMVQAAPPSPPMAPAPVPVTIPINNMSDPDIPRVHSESSIGSEPAPVPMARVASIASLPPRAASIVATVIRAPSMNRVPSLHQELAVQRIESMRRIPSATVAQVPSLAKMAPEPTAPDPAAVSPRTGVALAAFRMYDVDGSGELDVDEFHKAMQEMGMGYTFEDAENLFMMMDEDGNGVMSLPEFMAHCQEYIRNGNGAGPLSEAQAEDQARLAFKRYDTDGNGFLDVQEFLQAVKDLGLGTTIEDAEAIFSMADDDGNGTMECEEFVQHCVVAIQNQGQFTEVPDNVPLRSKKSLRKKPSMHTTGDPKVDAVNTFNKFDIDDSGYLDIYEFMSAMKELGLGFTFEDAKSLFSQIDVDDSGTMDVEEFTEHYIKYCHQA